MLHSSRHQQHLPSLLVKKDIGNAPMAAHLLHQKLIAIFFNGKTEGKPLHSINIMVSVIIKKNHAFN